MQLVSPSHLLVNRLINSFYHEIYIYQVVIERWEAYSTFKADWIEASQVNDPSQDKNHTKSNLVIDVSVPYLLYIFLDPVSLPQLASAGLCTLFIVEVLIRFIGVQNNQADPAEVSIAFLTCHFIAPAVLLDVNVAARTLLNVQFHHFLRLFL